MRYAITPKGIGNRPGARCIRDDTPLAPGETFTVPGFNPEHVLAEDSVSLRERTPEEIDAEAAAVVAVDAERAAQAALQGMRSKMRCSIASKPRPRRRSIPSWLPVSLLSTRLSGPW